MPAFHTPRRPDCDKFFFWYDAAEEGGGAEAERRREGAGPPRVGSCGWDSRVRRCTVLPLQKEPCLLAAAGIGPGGEPSREYSKMFESSREV